MYGRRYQRKRGFKRVVVTLLSFVLLLSVCFPGLRASAEGEVTLSEVADAYKQRIEALNEKKNQMEAETSGSYMASLEKLYDEIKTAFDQKQITEEEYSTLQEMLKTAGLVIQTPVAQDGTAKVNDDKGTDDEDTSDEEKQSSLFSAGSNGSNSSTTSSEAWSNVVSNDTPAPYATSSGNAGTFNHIEIEVTANATVVVDGTAYPINVSLSTADFTKDTTTIVAKYGDTSVTLNSMSSTSVTVNGVSTYWNKISMGTSTADVTVSLDGNYPTGTLDNPVYYTVTIKKTVTQTINGQSYTIPVTLTVTTNYWDPDNHCPPLSQNQNTNNWKNGEFIKGSGIDIPVGGTGSYTSQGDLNLTKYVTGVTVPEGGLSFTFNVYDSDLNFVATVPMDVQSGNSIATYTLAKLAKGTYYIVETSASSVSGYTHTSVSYSGVTENDSVTTEQIEIDGVTYNAAKVEVKEKQTVYVNATNAYAATSGDLTIQKNVQGVALSDAVVYAFTIHPGNNVDSDALAAWVENNSGYTYEDGVLSATITVDASSLNGSITLEDLPSGTYTVTEATPGNIGNYDYSTTSYQIDSGSVVSGRDAEVSVDADGTTVAFTNTYVQATSTLTINKIFNNEESDFALPQNVTVTVNGTEYILLPSEAGSRTYTKTIPNVLVGTEYSVREIIPSITDWEHSETGSVTYGSVVISRVENENVISLSNTYIRSVGTLTITKIFSGLPAEADYPAVSFIVTGPNDYNKTIVLDGSTKEIVDGVEQDDPYETVAWTATLLNLPVGSYTIEEIRTNNTLPDIGNYQYVDTKVGDVSTVTASTYVNKQNIAAVSFTNVYERKTAVVTISKSVTGNLGDISKSFDFEVEISSGDVFTQPGMFENGAVPYTVSSDGTKAYFSLKDGQSVLIKDVPVGASLTIKETNATDYKVTINESTVKEQGSSDNAVKDGILVKDDGITIEVVNNKKADVDTGVSVDSTPFIIILTIIAISVAFILLNKRRYHGMY